MVSDWPDIITRFETKRYLVSDALIYLHDRRHISVELTDPITPNFWFKLGMLFRRGCANLP